MDQDIRERFYLENRYLTHKEIKESIKKYIQMAQETQIGNLSGGISDEDSKLVDSILNDINGGGGGGICLTSALLLNIGNAGGGTNRCFRLLFLLYNHLIFLTYYCNRIDSN